MGELTIRRDRILAAARYQGADRAKEAAAAVKSQGPSRTTGLSVSETLQRLMSKASQAEERAREGRRTLQTGETVLAEVQDSLSRMAELAKRAAESAPEDRAALQEELDRLAEGIGRMIGGASVNGAPLFLDEDLGTVEDLEALLQAVTEEGEEVQPLPDWLVRALDQDLDPQKLLDALGLDRNATSADLLAAVMNSSLEGSPAVGALAALYLGAVIAGSADQALEGLQMLLQQVADGVPLDRAVELLTSGLFSGIGDFQARFTSGTAPGLQTFLTQLLLSQAPAQDLTGSTLLGLLAGGGGTDMDLMLMGLLTVLQPLQAPPEGTAARAGEEGAPVPLEAADRALPFSAAPLGQVQGIGRDLSGLSFDPATGLLTVSGTADVILQGMGQEPQAVLIAGSGRVTLLDVQLSQLTVTAPQARVSSAGESALGQVLLSKGASLVLEGSGLLKIAALRGEGGNVLRLAGGAAVLSQDGRTLEALSLPAVLDGPASLAAGAGAAGVTSSAGRPLEPFDLVWKALLPSWSALTSLTVDGRQIQTALGQSFPIRLWLDKGDPSHGWPVHALALRGKDALGRLKTRYAYLRWDQRARAFQEVPMYPNPFTVTGGEDGLDWVYEEELHALHILSSRVTALSGGVGTDADQVPFSGRIVLADRIGRIALDLEGVDCRVSFGRAFDLGRENQVSLALRPGTEERFESGPGFAGISLGEDTSLTIRRQSGDGAPGTLTAVGHDGGAGIGRDCAAGRERSGKIHIQGGVIQALGEGGGAGIGAGKHSPAGPFLMTGGTVTAVGGKGGGAGIGAGLGAAAGDITIRGGCVWAEAASHAAAIGAAVQGTCGDIQIAGTAKIAKAEGGDPGADIGACLFGGCGQVDISGGADIGRAKLRTRSGIPLGTGGESVTLPQFRLSAGALRLDRLLLSTPEQARTAGAVLETGRRWVGQIQSVYSALYVQMEQSASGLRSVQRYISVARVRDASAAGALLEDMRRSILLQPGQAIDTHSGRGAGDVGQLLDRR